MSEYWTYSEGGYLPGVGQPEIVQLHPDECVINLQAVCQRRDHPTATSDCTTKAWIRSRP